MSKWGIKDFLKYHEGEEQWPGYWQDRERGLFK